MLTHAHNVGPSITEIGSLLAVVTQQQELLTEFQVEIVKMLQHLHQEQQRMSALIEAMERKSGDASQLISPETPRPAVADPLSAEAAVLCIGLSEADGRFGALRDASATGTAVKICGLDEALTIARARMGKGSTTIEFFDLARIIQNTDDMKMAAALSDGLFHGIRIADKLGAVVAWNINDLPTPSGTNAQAAQEFFRQIANAPVRISVASDDVMQALRIQYPALAKKAGSFRQPGFTRL
ncbi:hypothetical protein ACO34A_04465 [Rhizobium sp. ACO-34A]|nr:hypothetical protein ACO34A_04465 [Rhizobium sp. ACO-34A]